MISGHFLDRSVGCKKGCAKFRQSYVKMGIMKSNAIDLSTIAHMADDR
jgi:hypothetical protein